MTAHVPWHQDSLVLSHPSLSSGPGAGHSPHGVLVPEHRPSQQQGDSPGLGDSHCQPSFVLCHQSRALPRSPSKPKGAHPNQPVAKLAQSQVSPAWEWVQGTQTPGSCPGTQL